MSLSTFGTALLSVITPWSARWGGWQVFCVIRAGQGLFQGTMLPCIYEHSRKSFTLKAQYKLAAWILSAMHCGTFFALAISGLIAESPIGWPGISYFSGGLCFGCCILWWIFSAANNVVESIITAEMDAPNVDSALTHKEAVSWKTILLSMSFFAIFIVRLSEAWGLSILQEQMPLYTNGVLNLNIKLNGIFSALPFLLMLGLSYIFDFLAKFLQSKKVLSSWSIPITLSIIGSWLPAIGLVAIGFLDKSHKTWILLITTICGGVYSSATIGSSWNANHIEIIHTISNFMPLISPLVMKAIVTDLVRLP